MLGESRVRFGQNSRSGQLKVPLYGPDTMKFPFAHPLLELGNLMAICREGVWAVKMNLSQVLILIA